MRKESFAQKDKLSHYKLTHGMKGELGERQIKRFFEW